MPNVKQAKNVPVHISAITNSQINIDKPSGNVLSSTPTSPNNVQASHNSGENNINESSVQDSKCGAQTSKKNRKHARNMNGGNYNSSQSNNDYNQINQLGQNQFQPQLVPIQTFSFFKWKINVDTLVRLFIIA